jgi:hypothetical protein
MDKILIEFDEKAAELKELVDKLKNYLGEIAISKKLRDGFTAFYHHVALYSESTDSEDVDKISTAANAISVYGQLIGQGIAQFKDADNQMKSIGSELLKKSTEYRNFVENSPLEYKSMDPNLSTDSNLSIASYKSVKNSLKKLTDDHLAHDLRIKKQLSESEARAVDLSNQIEKIDDNAKIEFNKITSLYEDALNELQSKKEQIDEILGHVSGRAIAGDFETSATEEKQMANWLRYASLGCMATIVIVVGYSFWETTTTDFQWQNSIFRIVLAVMLSVPAAYLARESAKHREQQYNHLQTSLDLKAITPYISSLPTDEQHKIKVEVASRMFAAKDFSKVAKDPYSINVHEIVMELIKKIELKK